MKVGLCGATVGSAVLCVAGAATAHPAVSDNRLRLPPRVWAVELASSTTTLPSAAYFASLRAAGVNAILVDATTATAARAIGRSSIASSGLVVLVSTPGARRASLRAPFVCARKATSIAMALRVAQARSAPTVVHVAQVDVLSQLARSGGRIVAVVPYAVATADPAAWTGAIDLARSSKVVDLAIGPPRGKTAAGLANPFPGLRPGPTSAPPSAPPGPVQNLRMQSVDPISAVLAWDPPAVGTADHYELFANDVASGTTAAGLATVAGLTCGVSVNLGVDAVAADARRSSRATLTVTPPCAPGPTGGGGGGDGGDTTPPVVKIVSGPPAATNATTALLAFSASELSTFECSLDGGVLGSCTSPAAYARVADGSHTFQVWATDLAGNVSALSSYNWTVDATPPETSIASAAPASQPGSTSASFSFSSSEGGSTFRCQLDAAPIASCSSPVSYSGLADGSHTFHVQATDTVGNADPTPAGVTWTVLRADVFVSTTGDDATCVRGDSSQPCRTFNKAFQVAEGGDVVEVLGGTYTDPGQTQINIDTHLPSLAAAVTFRPAPGSTVLLGESIDIRASHFHMIGISSAGSGESRHSLAVCAVGAECPTELTDVLVEGFSGKSAFIRSSGVTVRGGEYGNYDPCIPGNSEDIFRLWSGGGAAQPNNDVVDGVTLHDDDDHHAAASCPGMPTEGIHVECMQADGGTHITIENTTIYNCATGIIQAQPFGVGPFGAATMNNWIVENNFFGNVLHPGNSVVLGKGNCSTLVLRYNTFLGPQPNAGDCTLGNLVGYGNIFLAPASATDGHFDQSWSVFTSGSTAAVDNGSNHNRKCDPIVLGAASSPPNLHLGPLDTCAKGAGDPLNFPVADIDGDPRPSGGRPPDAGADELP